MSIYQPSGANVLKESSLCWMDRSVDALQLSVRASNCLSQAGIQTVGQLMERTEVQLLRLPNLGVETLREIRSALQSFREEAQSSRTQECSPPLEPGEPVGGQGGHGELDEIRAPPIVDGRYAVLAFSNTLTARDRSVLQHRVFRSDITLEDLGERFAVTRERIRQVEVQLLKRFRAYLRNPKAASIEVCAKQLRECIGRSAPTAAFDGYCKRWAQLDGVSVADQALLAASIGWIAGPYRERDGWVSVADYSARQITDALLEARDARGWISSTAAHHVLDRAGIKVEFTEAWLTDHRFAPMDDGWLPVLRSIPDRAGQILRYRGVPVTAEALCTLVDCESERSLRNRLNEDRRFKRVSRQGHYALREWTQYDEYSGIAVEIAEEIDRQGGVATSQHLIDVLSARFGVKSNSVSQYLSAPMFVKERGGRVRLRTAEEALIVRADPVLCQGLYYVDPQWQLRLEISRDTLRGSGRPLHTAVAVIVGCQPGERRMYRSPADEVVVSWPPGSAAGANLGSLKPDVEALGGKVGDFVFLLFGPERIDVRLLQAATVRAAVPLRKLELLLGLPLSETSETDRLGSIGAAIGLTSRDGPATPSAIHDRLMRRNEVDLANILRDAYPSEGDDILESLGGQLGL
jgi:hypothetical protein